MEKKYDLESAKLRFLCTQLYEYRNGAQGHAGHRHPAAADERGRNGGTEHVYRHRHREQYALP